MNIPLSAIDFQTIFPELIVFGMGMLVLLLEVFRKGRSTQYLGLVSLAGLAAAAWAVCLQDNWNKEGFYGAMASDQFSVAFKLIFLVVTALTVLLSMPYLERRRLNYGEFYALLLFATGGMMVMASGLDLLMIFIGLEILSIASYILAGMLRHDAKSTESALKYFLLGAFATGFLLYGIMLIYGATGSVNLRQIAQAMSNPELVNNGYVWFGMGLMIVGFGFKLSLVPFHMWAPDVYEGAPTAVTAFFSAGPKAAGFAALVRVMVEGLSALQAEWGPIFWVLAALTMTLGNLVAIQQNNIKRMLAYSSVAHAGYLLAALVVGSKEGLSAIVFYALAYAFMNMGVFAILILAAGKGQERLTFDDFKGFGYVSPLLAIAMFVFLLSLIGIPLTGGFVGKFQIFMAVVNKGYLWLALLGVLNSVISVYYYLRLIVVMYMVPGDKAAIQEKPAFNLPLAAAVAISLAGVLYLGLTPAAWIKFSVQSVAAIGGLL